MGDRKSELFVFRQKLQSFFEEERVRRGKFSFRAYAYFLEMDPSTLKQLIEGKRYLGPKLIRRLGKKIGMSDEELKRFINFD